MVPLLNAGRQVRPFMVSVHVDAEGNWYFKRASDEDDEDDDDEDTELDEN